MPNQPAINAATQVVNKVIAEFLARNSLAVVCRAPAGAGKSGLVTEAVIRAAVAGMRLLVTAPTNAQVHSLVDRIARQAPKWRVTYFRASSENADLPANLHHRNVIVTRYAEDVASASLVLATLDKIAYNHSKIGRFDGLVMDEAYQADSAKYFSAAGLAPKHLLVGDSGQLQPFTTLDGDPWRGLPENPLQTAVDVLLRNHRQIRPHPLPITRRLSPSAARMARHFYPGMTFESATTEGDRELALGRRTGRRSARDRALDATLDTAAATGWAYLGLPRKPVLVHDPEIAATIVDLAARLLNRNAEISCERSATKTRLTPADIAIGVSHHTQRHAILQRLPDALKAVTVDTANRLQGLEFQIVIVWHPLAGMPEADPFHLEAGRLCVLLTRHRHACMVVGRTGDAELVDALAPATPAFIGDEADPVLDGWEVHRAVFAEFASATVNMPA